MSVHDILENGYLGNLTNPGALQSILAYSNDKCAELCFVSPETFRRWRSDRVPNPCAIRLLSILAGYVPWPDWGKFFFNPHDNMIYAHDLKYGFTPEDLYALHYLRQGFEAIARENQRLRQDIGALEAKLDPVASIEANSNIVLFPTLKAVFQRKYGTSESAKSGKTLPSWLRDRFSGFGRKNTG